MVTLVTGASGFVGARIMAALPGAVAAPSLRNTDQEAVRRLVEQIAPDAIIHTAAISDIGACERDPEGSYRANVLLPEYLARAAKGIKLTLFSTDQVYSGCDHPGPFREDDTAPANTYARHKLEMERRVLEIDPDAVLLRATWMYDMPLYGMPNRGNFLMNMLRAAATGQPIAFSDVQRRGITYVRHVAQRMEQALSLPGGAYNFGSESGETMYEAARFLADELGLRIDLHPLSEERRDLNMDCAKLRACGVAFPDTLEGLRACIADYSL